jgi:hypothetical protein
LFDAARRQVAIRGEKDEFGERFVIDFDMQGPGGAANVRSSWIVQVDEDFPRLTTCYVF